MTILKCFGKIIMNLEYEISTIKLKTKIALYNTRSIVINYYVTDY
jgi:hypothetical protein